MTWNLMKETRWTKSKKHYNSSHSQIQNLHLRLCPITFHSSTWQGTLLLSSLPQIPSCFCLKPCFLLVCPCVSHHSSPTLSRVPLEAFLLAPVSPGIILSPSMASTKKMKWVLKLSGCPLTLAMKLDLIPLTWHIPKSQTSFYLKSCFSLIHLLTLPTVLSSPNTTLIMSHPCLKPFLPQVASIQRGNSNISTKEQSPAILSYQCGSLQPSSSPFPWSGPSPLTPSPPRCSLGPLGSDDYSLTQVIVSTQECPLHFSA